MQLSRNAQLVEHLKSNSYISSKEVERAFLSTERKNFVPSRFAQYAYQDTPLSIGEGQTISAPSVVAVMSEALNVQKGMKVLEIGSGSGYQAAVLARLVGKKGMVFTIERIAELAQVARNNLEKDGVQNVQVICADGSKGLEREAPLERIAVTAAAREMPKKLWEQLAEGGKMVILLGESTLAQELFLIEKKKGVLEKTKLLDVAFVPLVND